MTTIKPQPSPHRFDDRFDPYHFAALDRRRFDWGNALAVALLIAFVAFILSRPLPVEEHRDASHDYLRNSSQIVGGHA